MTRRLTSMVRRNCVSEKICRKYRMVFHETTTRVVTTMELYLNANFLQKRENFHSDEEMAHNEQCEKVRIVVVIVKTTD